MLFININLSKEKYNKNNQNLKTIDYKLFSFTISIDVEK